MASNFIIVSDDFEATSNKVEDIKNGYNITSEIITYDLSEENVYSLVDELTTVSLFEDIKFVVVKEAENLLGKNEKAFIELQKAMNDVYSSNILVLLFKKVDYSNQDFQKLRRFSAFFEIKQQNIKLDEYAINFFKENGFKYDNEVINTLVNNSTNLSSLKTMLAQLECFRYDEKHISNQDVLSVITQPLDDNIYSLIDAVLSNDKKHVMKCYQDLKLRSVQATAIISMLISKFQEMYNVNVLLKGGLNQGSLAELFGISPGRAFYMIKNAKSYHINSIKENLNLLNDLELKIKSGKIDQNLGLELYFLH